MRTTSEVAVSLTFANSQYRNQIAADLRELGTGEIEENQTILCMGGDCRTSRTG